MMKHVLRAAFLAATCAAAHATTASALVYTGEIEFYDFEDRGYVNVSINRHDFTVTSAGSVDFDMLAYESSSDLSLIGPADTQNYIDSMIQVHDRASDTWYSAGDWDGSLGNDGSVSGLDPHMVLTLGVGNYSVYVSEFSFDPSWAILGYNYTGYYPGGYGERGFQRDSVGDMIIGSPADYQLTITGITGTVDLAGAPVPAPAAAPLLGCAIITVGWVARRRARLTS